MTVHMMSVYTQEAFEGGENLSWLLEKKLLWQRLECLQQAVARLEHEKSELKQLNVELKITLEQVKKAFTASAVLMILWNSACFHIQSFRVLCLLPTPMWRHSFTFSFSTDTSLLSQMNIHSGPTLLALVSPCTRIWHSCQELPLALSLP